MSLGLGLLIVTPLICVMVIAVEDIWTRSGHAVGWRVTWTVLCLFLWPALVLYFGLHPMAAKRGRRVITADHGRGDARTALVNTVLAHDEGRISDDEYHRRVAGQRAESASQGG